MSDQYLHVFEETTRGTTPGSPTYLVLPVIGALQPNFVATDESRKEFRGPDTALGNVTVVRRSTQWTYTLECLWYPDSLAIGLLLKHFFGNVATRNVLDTTAYAGILYPDSQIYGDGPLGTKAIGLAVHSDEAGTTKKQVWGGGRIKSLTITATGTDDIKLAFEIQGSGTYVGTPDQTADSMETLPSASPYTTGDLTCYAGSGISRTGTAPEFTDIDPGTMNAFIPDSITVKITNGMDDKNVMDGVAGPTKTFRSGQWLVEVTAPMDYEDPSSGFSSADEFKRLFSGTATTALLLVLDNGELAGSASEDFQAFIDIASGLLKCDTVARDAEGKQPTVELGYTGLNTATTEYPVAIFTIDQADAY